MGIILYFENKEEIARQTMHIRLNHRLLLTTLPTIRLINYHDKSKDPQLTLSGIL